MTANVAMSVKGPAEIQLAKRGRDWMRSVTILRCLRLEMSLRRAGVGKRSEITELRKYM